MAKDPARKPMQTASEDLEQEIRLRAYKLYEERGREDGHALDDWLQAKTEILGVEQEEAAA